VLVLVLMKVIDCVCVPPPRVDGLLSLKEAMLNIFYMPKCIG
jgi:hypothetical protein